MGRGVDWAAQDVALPLPLHPHHHPHPHPPHHHHFMFFMFLYFIEDLRSFMHFVNLFSNGPKNQEKKKERIKKRFFNFSTFWKVSVLKF